MGKLTEAQARIMRYLAGGHRITVTLFMSKIAGCSLNGMVIPKATLNALLRRGLIAESERIADRAILYSATTAGRTALSAAKPTQKDEDNG